jgi:hypothetical protein
LRLEAIAPEQVRQVAWEAARGVLTLKSLEILPEDPPKNQRRRVRLSSSPEWKGDISTTKMDLAVEFYAQGCDSYSAEQRLYGSDPVHPTSITPWGSNLGLKQAYWVSQAHLPSHMGVVLVDEWFCATVYFSQPLEVSSRRLAQDHVEAKDRQQFETICRRMAPGLKKIAQEAL